MNIVIVGASRGIGLGFVKHYLHLGHTVWAGCRTLSGELTQLNHTALRLFQWDVSKDYSRSDVQRKKLPDTVHLLINNAGIYGPKKGGQTLETVTREGLHEVFDINCIGAIMATQALKYKLAGNNSIIANISSKMGSSADNSSGGTYAYRTAKAALIMASKSMAVDLQPQGVQVITLHPGWVRTDMTGHSGLIAIEESVQGMCHVIKNARRYQPGDFIAFDGLLIPY